MSKRKRVTIRKYMGDDRYSWAVFLDGQVRMTGMGKTEAEYEQELIRRKHAPDEAKGKNW
jgi:hypothetical protein